MKTHSLYLAIIASLGVSLGACVSEGANAGGEDSTPTSSIEATVDNPTSEHRALLAKPPTEPALARRALDSMPVVYDKDGKVRAAQMPTARPT